MYLTTPAPICDIFVEENIQHRYLLYTWPDKYIKEMVHNSQYTILKMYGVRAALK